MERCLAAHIVASRIYFLYNKLPFCRLVWTLAQQILAPCLARNTWSLQKGRCRDIHFINPTSHAYKIFDIQGCVCCATTLMTELHGSWALIACLSCSSGSSRTSPACAADTPDGNIRSGTSAPARRSRQFATGA